MGLENEFTLIKQGAEAKLFKGSYLGKMTVVKERFKKSYRHFDLDNHLTKERMKSEARALLRCKLAGICTPALYLVDFERRRMYMEYVENSVTLKEHIMKITEDITNGHDNVDTLSQNLNSIAQEIGRILGKLHSHNIIHGDLTTSNMLLVKDGKNIPTIVLIDFGLSHVESSMEDKGVDLYVLERALISTHANVDKLFTVILSAYAEHNKRESKEVLKKLEEIRARGRKRTMVG
ncbi:EKC/KEOPS complex subunit TP53RK [Periplaneta americana]|uniref:EKC/KEOPS complex subunit TP53RK n=1 Tax=Periplaneta americana TaxID=6978 RepID=UPI0037E78498